MLAKKTVVCFAATTKESIFVKPLKLDPELLP